ncbi:hypothetical protein [Mycobacteroides abscessus]|uniref:hypothetical protein n=1 Tax=Mycobacteroides abscessus TaxID=36809 RepID=UPI0014906754|nr:hypothetical protein [Mycobacteroides abscessus]
MIKIKPSGRDISLRAVLTLSSAYAVIAVCTAAPAQADPSQCERIPGLCDLTSTTPQTPIVVPNVAPLPEPTGVDRLRAASPDLSLFHFLGVGLILFGLIAIYGNRRKVSGAVTAAEGAVRAEAATESSAGGLMVGAGIISLGYALGGVGGLVIGGVIGGLIIASAVSRGSRSATATSGYKQALVAWQQDTVNAELAAQMHRPNPAEYDPLGLGVAPPPAPKPVLPPEPVMTDDDALRFARVGGHVELIPGSAAAALVARDGSWHAAETAWIAACKAANLGSIEQRSSRVPGVNSTSEVWVPAADLVRVDVLAEGDAAVVVRPRGLNVGAEQLKGTNDFLRRTARIRHTGGWLWNHSDDTFTLVLSNRDLAAQEQSSGPEPAGSTAGDDDEDW